MSTVNNTTLSSLSVDCIDRTENFSPEIFGIKVDPSKKVAHYKGFPLDNAFSAYVPKLKPDYVFEAEIRMSVLMWINFPLDQALWIYGPTGCGKTSVIEQTAARLNWPVMKITASPELEISSLIGSFRLVCDQLTGDTKTEFYYGPLALAYKFGLVFLLDEIDKLDSVTSVAFNSVLEGGNLIIPETGEVITMHKNFRFVATANSIGQGDQTGIYNSSKQQDAAYLDRYMFINSYYMKPEVEVLLLNKITGLPEVSAKFVEVANMIRSLFVGDDVTGFSASSPVNAKLPGEVANMRLSMTCSTRSLEAWVKRYAFMQKAKIPNAFQGAFDYHIGNRATSDEKKALEIIVKSAFGQDVF